MIYAMWLCIVDHPCTETIASTGAVYGISCCWAAHNATVISCSISANWCPLCCSYQVDQDQQEPCAWKATSSCLSSDFRFFHSMIPVLADNIVQMSVIVQSCWTMQQFQVFVSVPGILKAACNWPWCAIVMVQLVYFVVHSFNSFLRPSESLKSFMCIGSC